VINKVEKGVFTLDNNKTLPEGKILLVDDIITSGSAIVSAIQTLLKTGKYQLEDIDILCIGKTERDLNVWDNNKVIANLT
jgi:predicted amidophosphoribosyltransferase